MSGGASTVVGLPFTLSETFIGRGARRLLGWRRLAQQSR